MPRLLIVQYAGDYREAYRRIHDDGSEVYYGHSYVLEQMAQLAGKYGSAGFMCCMAPSYEDILPSGVAVFGAGCNPEFFPARAIKMIERFDPTHLIVQGPIPSLIKWGLRKKIAVGCILADSFAMHPLYRLARYGRIPGLLNDPRVTLVANHGKNAAKGLVALGVRPEKVIAWDYPHQHGPDRFKPKSAPKGPTYHLLYVGSVSAKKGVGDLLAAVALLAPRIDIRLGIVGSGRIDKFRAMAARLSISDRVTFEGLVPNSEIMPRMHKADAVVVPSRHAFPEGLPLTLYEGLASRTPTVASDHPMFAGHMQHRHSAMLFEASQPERLAAVLGELLQTPALYEHISSHAHEAWLRMQVPVKWGELVDHWVSGGKEDSQWLYNHSLATRGGVDE